MKKFMRKIRNSHLFAFLQGAWEQWSSNGCGGRTHATDQGWNEAYDRGMNLGDRFLGMRHG